MTTWTLGPFVKVDSLNPILLPVDSSRFYCPLSDSIVHWEEKDVFNPTALVKDGQVHLLYRAEDSVGRYAGTSRIGLATSTDGLHFRRRPEPIFYPAPDSLVHYEWEGGCEDPRLVEDKNGVYYMTYTAYDGDKARLLIASSPDLRTWTKHGSVFTRALGGRYVDMWSKSGAIVCRLDNERWVATQINGSYWMYFGDTDLFLAQSPDLIHWTPVLKPNVLPDPAKPGTADELLSVLSPRPGQFDSRLVEPGPPAFVTEQGILLIYNSMNSDTVGDPDLPAGTYAAGQALFSANDPSQLIDRTKEYFFKPEKDYEITGQINNVCFLEGLVFYQDKWYLYYGTADSKIAVAVYDPNH